MEHPTIYTTISNVIDKTPRSLKIVYKTAICFGLIYGGYRGLKKGVDWLRKRKEQKTNVPVYQHIINPVYNIGRDFGHLAWYTTSSAVLSGFIVATLPVSIPILSIRCKDCNDEQE